MNGVALINPVAFDSASARCAGAMPNSLICSSKSAGWTSVLLDHVHGEGGSERFETAATSDVTVVVATQGEHLVEVFKNGRWRQAIYQTGAAGMTPGGETTRMRWSARECSPSFRSAHLYLPQALLLEAADHFSRVGQVAEQQPLSSLVFNDSAIARAVDALLKGMAAGAQDIYAQQVAISLVSHLVSNHSRWRDGGDVREIGVISDARLARTVAFMSSHLSEPLSIDRLASEAAMSKFNFARAFRQKTGSTPHAFLLDLRLTLARRLLATTDLPILEISDTCGYPNSTHFATSFKRRYGVSPRGARYHGPH